jgi:uncharacterized membrane protein required for colicin V production
MTKVDLIALGFVALTAFIGWKKGLISTALSLAGIVLGAWLGSRLAPELLQGGKHSPYTPLAALVGAAVGAILLETLGTLAGSALRSRVRKPKLTTFDATGGLVLGTLSGLAIVWVIGAVALLLPGQTDLRRGAQSSALLQRLNEVLSPTDVLDVLARLTLGLRVRSESVARHPVWCACSEQLAMSEWRGPAGPRGPISS